MSRSAKTKTHIYYPLIQGFSHSSPLLLLTWTPHLQPHLSHGLLLKQYEIASHFCFSLLTSWHVLDFFNGFQDQSKNPFNKVLGLSFLIS